MKGVAARTLPSERGAPISRRPIVRMVRSQQPSAIVPTAIRPPQHARFARMTSPSHEHHASPALTPQIPARHDHSAMMADPAHAQLMEADMRRRFWVALAFTVPVTVLAGHLPGLSTPVAMPLASWLQFGLSLPVVWWAGWIFISGSYHALRGR